MSEGEILLLLGALAATVGSAWFNCSELVLLSLEKIKLPGRLSSGMKGAQSIHYFLDRPERFLTTILAGNNLVNTAFAACSGILMKERGVPDLLILFFQSGFLLMFAEATPKALGRAHAERLSSFIAIGLRACRIVLYPPLWALERSVRWLQRVLHLAESTSGLVYTRADIALALNSARRIGAVPEEEVKLIRRLLGLEGKVVADLMTPRTRVDIVPLDASIEQAAEKVIESGHKRLVVVGTNPDDILGVVHAKDLFRGAGSIRSIIQPLPMAPESLEADRLTEWLRRHHTHFAGVVDEYGGFAGVVSLEDLAIELVGPIADAEKPESVDWLRMSPVSWLVRGRARLGQFSTVIGFEPVSRAATMAGWAAELAEAIPEEGEEFETDLATLRIVKANPRGALLIRVTLKPSQQSASPS